MKYGLLIHNYGESAASVGGLNIGDPFQSLVVEYIYRQMNIPECDIQRLPLCELKNYQGEYLLLPTAGVAMGSKYAPLPLSPRIIPVFISMHLIPSELTEEAVAYLRGYEPIGCRDERTLNTLRRYGIQAYLSGCITAVIPRRGEVPEAKKMLLIDTPESLEQYLPDNIRSKAERLTHLLPLPNRAMTQAEAEELYRVCRARLESYRREAALVISSRMHALVPCMAMGIPVIGVFENISYRFSWFDKYIRLYPASEFSQIDWHPAAVDYEDTKKKLLELFCAQIQAAYEKYVRPFTISGFYEDRKRALYGSHYIERIRTMHSYMPEEFDYLIWGCGLIGENALSIMRREFPKAHCAGAVDSFITGVWHDLPVISPDRLTEYPCTFVILANYSGREECREYLRQLGYVEDKDFLYIASRNG